MGFERLQVLGWREGLLKKLVESYKYEGAREVGAILGGLLVEMLKGVEEEAVVVPLPTISRHVRARGFDHTLLLAKELTRRKNWELKQVIRRREDTVQVGAKRAVREQQAKRAYRLEGALDATKLYILIDDVWTTGASMRAAAELMRLAGVKRLWGLVVATGRPKGGYEKQELSGEVKDDTIEE